MAKSSQQAVSERLLCLVSAVVLFMALDLSPALALEPQPAGDLDAPEGIARDAAGNLYVAQINGEGFIYRAEKGTNELKRWATIPGRRPQLLGLAVDESRGLLYACAVGVHGGAVYSIPLGDPRRGRLLCANLGFPNALALHGNELLVSDSNRLPGLVRGRILAIDLSGASQDAGGEPRILLRLKFPNGLAVSGNVLYVAQTKIGFSGLGAVAAYRFRGDGSLEEQPFARRDLGGWPDGLLVHGRHLFVALQKARTICRLDARDLRGEAKPGIQLVGRNKRCAPASMALGARGESLHFTDVQEPSSVRIFLGTLFSSLGPRAHHHVYELPLGAFDSPSHP